MQLDCAICLDKPLAAHITKCGHIYCLPCILHCAFGSPSVKCPLCFEMVCLSDAKILEFVDNGNQIKVGSRVDLLLLERKPYEVMPVRADAKSNTVFQRYQFVNQETLLESYCKQRVSIIDYLPFSSREEHQYLNSALDFLQHSEDNLCACLNSLSSSLSPSIRSLDDPEINISDEKFIFYQGKYFKINLTYYSSKWTISFFKLVELSLPVRSLLIRG